MEYHNPENIFKDIRNGILLPVYILHGEEPFFIERVTKWMEENLIDEGQRDFNLSVIYGRDVLARQVIDSARMFPMMGDRKLVILKEAHQMRDIDQLLPYLENPSPHTVLTIAHPGKKIDGRSKWMKTALASQYCGAMVSEKIKEYKLGAWLDTYINSQGRRITAQANHLLCEYLGNDLKKLTNELTKLELNLPADATIGTAEVEKYIGISKEFNVFELLNAVGRKEIARAYFIADNLSGNLQRNPMQMITPSFFQYFQKVYITKQSPHLKEPQLASTLRVNAFFVKEYKQASANYSLEKLEDIFELLKETDARVKGVDNRRTTQEDLLKEMIGRIFFSQS